MRKFVLSLLGVIAFGGAFAQSESTTKEVTIIGIERTGMSIWAYVGYSPSAATGSLKAANAQSGNLQEAVFYLVQDHTSGAVGKFGPVVEGLPVGKKIAVNGNGEIIGEVVQGRRLPSGKNNVRVRY